MPGCGFHQGLTGFLLHSKTQLKQLYTVWISILYMDVWCPLKHWCPIHLFIRLLPLCSQCRFWIIDPKSGWSTSTQKIVKKKMLNSKNDEINNTFLLLTYWLDAIECRSKLGKACYSCLVDTIINCQLLEHSTVTFEVVVKDEKNCGWSDHRLWASLLPTSKLDQWSRDFFFIYFYIEIIYKGTHARWMHSTYTELVSICDCEFICLLKDIFKLQSRWSENLGGLLLYLICRFLWGW